MDVLELADRLWRGEVETARYHPVGHHGGMAEIGEGVAFVPSFANVSAVDTEDGLVLVDTGSLPLARHVHAELRRWSGKRLNTAIYSHGHIDHVFGVPVWEEESAGAGWPGPEVVAHEAVGRRFDRYVLTAGYNQTVNRRQFGLDELVWPTEYRYPDRTYTDELTLEVGGVRIELAHEHGETDDHTVTWVPERRLLCCGDLFIWATPNAGNPQKVQRFPREWAQALRRMAGLGAEHLLPGHGVPVIGADRVRQALTDTAALLESLVDQALALMNAGARLDEVLHAVRPPADLTSRPYLRPVYDQPEFIVRNIWRLYGGWWDGNPATLEPAPERRLARELAELAGGPGALVDRALAILHGEPGDEPGGGEPTAPGEPAPHGTPAVGTVPVPGGTIGTAGGNRDSGTEGLRLAGHLVELAWLAAPEDPGVAEARRLVCATRADRASSTMATGIYRWAAREAAGDAPD